MIDKALPSSLATEFAELKRRLSALERSPQLKSSSIKGGTFTVYDSAGNIVGQLGQILDPSTGLAYSPDRGAGIQFTDPSSGKVVFEASELMGTGLPRQSYPWKQMITEETQSTTSGSFVETYKARIGLLGTDVLRADWTMTVNAADSAEVKVTAGGATSDTVTLLGATKTSWDLALNWSHGEALGGGPFDVRIYVRRSAGTTASVVTYEPLGLEAAGTAHSVGHTSGGLVAS